MYGFCKVYADNRAIFSEEFYHGRGLVITHWMPLPKHPMERGI